MKKQWIIATFILLLFAACSKSLNKEVSHAPLSQEQTSQQTQVSSTQEETQERTSHKVIYINKGSEEEAILSEDPEVYENNYYKYKDVSVIFKPEHIDQGADRGSLYDLVLSQNGKETILTKGGTSFYGGIFPLQITKIPYIVSYISGFGDAGVFSMNYEFINILNGKQLLMYASNTGPSKISSFDETGPGSSSSFYDVLEIENDVLSLVNKSLIDKCLVTENKKIEITHLLLNEKPIMELPEPAKMDCSEVDYGILLDENFTLIGPDKNFEKVIFSLEYNDKEVLGISEKLKHGTGRSSLSEKVKVIYKIDLRSKTVQKIQDNLWERESIKLEMD